MEQRFSIVENTGLKLEETFTFRVHTTRADVEQQISQDRNSWHPKIGPISFNHGLLANVDNYFELKFLPELEAIELYFSPSLSFKPYQVHVSGMKLSLIRSNGDVELDRVFQGYEDTQLNEVITSPMGFEYKNRYRVVNSGSRHNYKLLQHEWSGWGNQIKVEITVSKITRAEFTGSSDVSLNCLPDTGNNYGFINVRKFFLSSDLSDIKIRCETETFPAHVFVLSYNSPVFTKMFEHDTKESKEKCVEVKHANSIAVREMLRYFYTGKVNDLKDMYLELYELADRYMVDNLKALCSLALVQSVNKDNALEMYCFAREKEMPFLVQKAEQVLVANKTELIKNIADLQALLKNVPSSMAEDLFQLLWNKN